MEEINKKFTGCRDCCKVNIAVVGVTGLVGRTMIKELEEREIPIGELYLFASARSAGMEIDACGRRSTVLELTEPAVRALKGKVDYALFSAGGSVSLKFAPIFAECGITVIDNSSAWRMQDCPLTVPEVNPESLAASRGIIANPNCSTIQMVLPLKALNDRWGLERVVVSTYQSIAGAGQKGVNKLMNELDGKKDSTLSEKPIAFNFIFHDFKGDSDYTEEEMKMINETRKILGIPDLKITATCVRLPVLGGHGESLNIELKKDFDIEEVKQVLAAFPDIIVTGDREKYPTLTDCSGRSEVFVGRIRRDDSRPRTLNMWITADNIRKGAATNAVQILQLLIGKR